MRFGWRMRASDGLKDGKFLNRSTFDEEARMREAQPEADRART